MVKARLRNSPFIEQSVVEPIEIIVRIVQFGIQATKGTMPGISKRKPDEGQ